MVAVAKRDEKTSRITASIPSRRADVRARYRHLRAINRRLQRDAVNFLSHDAVSLHARRLGLPFGRTRVTAQFDNPTYAFDLLLEATDLVYAFDLALHTASAGRTPAIDHFARMTKFAPDSDEALMLMAMRNPNFTIIRVDRVHPAAGLVVTDMYRRKEIWLVDEAMERSISRGMIIATRLYTLESFSMTAGVALPLDAEMLRDMIDDMPQLDHDQLVEAVDDFRFVETVYRIGLARGVTKRFRYQDLRAI
jgi:hypothetical protein